MKKLRSRMLYLAPARSKLLRSLAPYTVVACFVRTRGRATGLAVSDPYLSCVATSAMTTVRPLNLRKALEGARVGAVALGLPLSRARYGRGTNARRRLARALGRSELSATWRTFAWDKRLTLEEARCEHAANEQWSAVEGLCTVRASKLPASVHAAVALQSLLDEEFGGWPNTFG